MRKTKKRIYALAVAGEDNCWRFLAFTLAAILAAAIMLAGCGGGGNSGGGTTPPALSVSCFPTQVEVGRTSQCSVSPATAGTWSVAQGPGSINSSGLYASPFTLSEGTSAVVRFTANDGRTAQFTLAIVGTPSPGDIVFWRMYPASAGVFCGSSGFCEDIFAMNADGTSVRRLTDNTAQEFSPAWSPDKTKVAFVRAGILHLMNSDGSGQRSISPAGYSDSLFPSWSPDGTKLVFVGRISDTGEAGIAVMNSDGTNPVQLTRVQCVAGCQLPGSPAFSPDGKIIAFNIANEAKVQEIWFMNSDGSNPRLLDVGVNPAWSPDGNKIAFTGNGGIWTMNADGTGGHFQVTFTPPGFTDRNPTWSPDGRNIAFERTNVLTVCEVSGCITTGEMHIWVVSAESGMPQKITSVGFNGQPNWR